MFYLERFIKAQDRGHSYEMALEEIREGRKWSHWIWYVFPQVLGLGNSEMSLRYSIDSLLEANAFMEDPVLSARLIEAATTVENVHNQQCYSMEEIFGDLDTQKVKSCMTLFDYVAPDSIFQRVLQNCFHDSDCQFTRNKLDPQYEWIRESAFKRHGMQMDQKAMFESGSFESGPGVGIDCSYILTLCPNSEEYLSYECSR